MRATIFPYAIIPTTALGALLAGSETEWKTNDVKAELDL